jgi:two-component system chemotaxis response regulator CheB
MDVEMPVMDGLTAVKRIMMETPVPIIMVSGLTEAGADATFRALEYGALDFIPKHTGKNDSNGLGKVGELLRMKIKAIVTRQRLRKITEAGDEDHVPDGNGSDSINRSAAGSPAGQKGGLCDLVAVGVSTGGPVALNRILPRLPEKFRSSMLIVQHMPPTFTSSFARRLNSISRLPVKEAEADETVAPGHVYVAPGGMHLSLEPDTSGSVRFRLSEEPAELLFMPSIDVMMKSAARAVQTPVLGVIMTGMGSDGLKGMSAIKERGGVTIAQDEASCVVYGMPKVCVEKGIVDHILRLDEFPGFLIRYAG